MARTAESIVLNIVEGCGGTSQREFARFLDISIKSSVELEAQLELAKDYGVLSPLRWKNVSLQVIDVRRMLCGLRSTVLESAASNPPSPQARRARRTRESADAKRETPDGER